MFGFLKEVSDELFTRGNVTLMLTGAAAALIAYRVGYKLGNGVYSRYLEGRIEIHSPRQEKEQ